MSENNEVTRKEFEDFKTKIEENNLMLKEALSTLDIVMNSIRTVCVICMCNKEESEPSLFEWLEQNMDKFKEMENIFKDTRKPN